MRYVQQEALKKIDDAEALTEVALNDKEKSVRCAAVRRINEVHGTDALVKVMQQSDDRYIVNMSGGWQPKMKEINGNDCPSARVSG